MSGRNQVTEFIEQLSAQMVEWEARIERLQAKADRATAAERAEYTLAGDVLRQKRDQAAEIIRAISTARTGPRETLKAEAERIQKEVRNLFFAATWD